MIRADVLLGALASAFPAQLDPAAIVSQALVSLMVPTVLLSPWLIRYWRRKMSAEAARDEATADETDAKAEVLLSGEARELVRAVREDAMAAHDDARKARAAEARMRRENAALWQRVDAWARHTASLEALMIARNMPVPARPPLIADDPPHQN